MNRGLAWGPTFENQSGPAAEDCDGVMPPRKRKVLLPASVSAHGPPTGPRAFALPWTDPRSSSARHWEQAPEEAAEAPAAKKVAAAAPAAAAAAGPGFRLVIEHWYVRLLRTPSSSGCVSSLRLTAPT